MNEENEEGPKEGAIGLGRAVDRARSSTVWSKSVAEQAKEGFQSLFKGKDGEAKEGCAVWPEEELLSLYVKDPSKAQLALTGDVCHGFHSAFCAHERRLAAVKSPPLPTEPVLVLRPSHRPSRLKLPLKY